MLVGSDTEKVAIRAKPSFTCAGVNWGIEHLKRLLDLHETIYVPNKNGLVHNERVTQELQAMGAVFVSTPQEIPIGAVVANSMHGLSPLDRRAFIEKELLHYDLSCPLVDQVHTRVLRAIEDATQNGKVAKILYWCKDTTQPEPKAILDLAPSHVIPVTGRSVLDDYQIGENEAYYADSQTTLNVQQGMALINEYRWKFKGLKSLSRMGVCFATYNRQTALHELVRGGIDMLIVFGSPVSNNTSELVRIGRQYGLPVDFLERATYMKRESIGAYRRVGVMGGASVLPDEGDKAIEILRDWGYKTSDLMVGRPEPTTFPGSEPPVYDYRDAVSQDVLDMTRTY